MLPLSGTYPSHFPEITRGHFLVTKSPNCSLSRSRDIPTAIFYLAILNWEEGLEKEIAEGLKYGGQLSPSR